MTPILFLLTLGNSVRGSSIVPPIIGLISSIFMLIVPVFFEFKNVLGLQWFGTDFFKVDGTDRKTATWYFIRVLLCLIGLTLVIMQCLNIIRIKSLATPKETSFIARFMAGSAIKYESGIKAAAALKTHNMVKNAYSLHKTKGRRGEIEISSSSNALALLNFNKQSTDTESVGGFFWLWKEFLNGSLLRKHGIMINSRLKIANILQLFLALCAPILYLGLIYSFQNTFQEAKIPMPADASCTSFFDPNKCFAPLNGNLGVLLCSDVNFTIGCYDRFEEADYGNCDYVRSIIQLMERNATADDISSFVDDLSCDLLMVPEYHELYSNVVGSVEDDFCSLKISSCYIVSNNTLCLLGMGPWPSIPYKILGTNQACQSNQDLQKISSMKNKLDISQLIPSPTQSK